MVGLEDGEDRSPYEKYSYSGFLLLFLDVVPNCKVKFRRLLNEVSGELWGDIFLNRIITLITNSLKLPKDTPHLLRENSCVDEVLIEKSDSASMPSFLCDNKSIL